MGNILLLDVAHSSFIRYDGLGKVLLGLISQLTDLTTV